jgi:hypothetical protein
MTRKLILYECELAVGPDGRPKTEVQKLPGPVKELGKLDADDARKAAKRLILEIYGKAVRSLSIDSKTGNVVAVLWKDGPPQAKKIPGWRWKRPPSSDTSVR